MAEPVTLEISGKYDKLRRAVTAACQEAERNARSGLFTTEEKSRWRRHAAALSEALK